MPPKYYDNLSGSYSIDKFDPNISDKKRTIFIEQPDILAIWEDLLKVYPENDIKGATERLESVMDESNEISNLSLEVKPPKVSMSKLVEEGYLHGSHDYGVLTSAEGQKKLGVANATGIAKYFELKKK